MQLLIHILVNGDDKNQLMILMQIAEGLYLFDPLFRDSMCSRISLTFCISEYISYDQWVWREMGHMFFQKQKLKQSAH